jgi:hypothetical protein
MNKASCIGVSLGAGCRWNSTAICIGTKLPLSTMDCRTAYSWPSMSISGTTWQRSVGSVDHGHDRAPAHEKLSVIVPVMVSYTDPMKSGS